MINVTQKQKEFLNECGIEVIEFKRWVLKLKKDIDDIALAIIKCINELAKRLEPILDVVKKYLGSDEISARDKYKFCKSIGIDYRPYIKRNQIYRCRNNC